VVAFVSAGAGFLLAVLWFDLMFDIQVFGHHERDLPEDVLVSLAGYYGRVTTAARPMSRLIAVVMFATLAAIVGEIVQRESVPWVGWVSLGLATTPIVLAAVHTLPRAVRLGARRDAVDRQSALARSICREHLFSMVAITALLVLQLSSA
jgi:hypothetical protein